MQKLHLPKGVKWGKLKVYCNKCQRTVKDLCQETGQPIKKCEYLDRHTFKVILHKKGTKKGRITKNLQTRDPYEALQLAIEFEQEIKDQKINKNSNPEIAKDTKQRKEQDHKPEKNIEEV